MAKKAAKNRRKLIVGSKYEGKYVAFSPSEGKKIIASGLKASTVIQKARAKGVEVPAIVFVPKADVTCTY
jgi:hypothetical protein